MVVPAGAAPEHCWVKFSDSPKTDFIIATVGEELASHPDVHAAAMDASTAGASSSS